MYTTTGVEPGQVAAVAWGRVGGKCHRVRPDRSWLAKGHLVNETCKLLRALPALSGHPPAAVEPVQEEPETLFLRWLQTAVDAGVAEPHAMTLSTVDNVGVPDARVLILKDVDRRGWAFTSTRSSAKASQLAANPQAALTFWWQPLLRSVRVRGQVVEAAHEESLVDLAPRGKASRAGIGTARWAAWPVVPSSVEFWRGSTDRRRTRLACQRTADGCLRGFGVPRSARTGSTTSEIAGPIAISTV